MSTPKEGGLAMVCGGPGGKILNHCYAPSTYTSRSEPAERAAQEQQHHDHYPQPEALETGDREDALRLRPPHLFRGKEGNVSRKQQQQEYTKVCPSTCITTTASSLQTEIASCSQHLTTTASAAPDGRHYPTVEATGSLAHEDSEMDLPKRLLLLQRLQQRQMQQQQAYRQPENATDSRRLQSNSIPTSFSEPATGSQERQQEPGLPAYQRAYAAVKDRYSRGKEAHAQSHEQPLPANRTTTAADACGLPRKLPAAATGPVDRFSQQDNARSSTQKRSASNRSINCCPEKETGILGRSSSTSTRCSSSVSGLPSIAASNASSSLCASHSATAAARKSTGAAAEGWPPAASAVSSSEMGTTAAKTRGGEPRYMPPCCPSAPAAAGVHSEKRLNAKAGKGTNSDKLSRVSGKIGTKLFGREGLAGPAGGANMMRLEDDNAWAPLESSEQHRRPLQQPHPKQPVFSSSSHQEQQPSCRPGGRGGSTGLYYGLPAETSPPLLSSASAAVSSLRGSPGHRRQLQLETAAQQGQANAAVLPLTRQYRQHLSAEMCQNAAYLQMEREGQETLVQGTRQKQRQQQQLWLNVDAASSYGTSQDTPRKRSRCYSITQPLEPSLRFYSASDGATAASKEAAAAAAVIEAADIAEEREALSGGNGFFNTMPAAISVQQPLRCFPAESEGPTPPFMQQDTASAGFLPATAADIARASAGVSAVAASTDPGAAPLHVLPVFSGAAKACDASVAHPAHCYYCVNEDDQSAGFLAEDEVAWLAPADRQLQHCLAPPQHQQQNDSFYVLQQHPHISNGCVPVSSCWKDPRVLPYVYYPVVNVDQHELQQLQQIRRSEALASNGSGCVGTMRPPPLPRMDQQHDHVARPVKTGPWAAGPAAAASAMTMQKFYNWRELEPHQPGENTFYCTPTVYQQQHAKTLPAFPCYSVKENEPAGAAIAAAEPAPYYWDQLPSTESAKNGRFSRYNSCVDLLHTLSVEMTGRGATEEGFLPGTAAGIQAAGNMRGSYGAGERSSSNISKRRAARRGWCCSAE